MRDDQKTKDELLKEVETLRKRVSKLTKKDSTLWESEEKWRSLLKNTPDIVMIVDRDGTIQFINHTMPGIKEQEVTGKRVYDYISPEHHDTMRKDLERVFQTGQSASQEISGVGSYGGLSWYQAEIGPIRKNGHVVAASIITRDTTERKKAEEKIEKFKEMADHATYGCAIADLNGNLTYINDSFAKMHGYAPAELIGKNLKNFHTDEQIKRVSQLNKRLIETGEDIRGEEVWHVRQDGTEFPTLMSNWILKDPDGNPYLLCATAVDITERKRAEEALRESEERYRTLLANLPQKIFLKDRNSVYISCNENYAGDFKIKSEGIVGKTDYDFYPKELAEKYRADDKRIMESGGTEDIEEKYIRQGQEMVVHTVKTPVKDAQGNVIAILGIFWDITEHKRSEDMLRESETRYRTLFQGAAEGIIVADIETTKFKYVNPAICEMLGYTEEELKRLGVPDIHRKEDLEYVVSEFKAQAREEKRLASNIPCLRKNGTIIYANINTTKAMISGKECNVGFFTDITEHKRADEALRESEERYRTLVESAGESIVMVNKDGVHLFVNETAAKQLGGKPEDYVGKTIWDAFPKKMADRQMAIIRKVISKGEGINSISPTEVQGQFRWFNATIEPLRDGSGKVTAAMVIARDIHELKLAEEELSLCREKMAHAERLASVGTLSATLAHELNQPLTTILLSIENSLADLETTSSPDTVIEYLKDGLTGVSDASSIVKRFSNFAMIPKEEVISEVNLKVVAERIFNLLNVSAQRARVSLHIKGMDQLLAIYSNEKNLEQLFFALVENAIQATDGKKSRRLIISGGVKDEHIELRFADDCCGIAPENLDKIFEPFFTTSPAGEGTGLGLCIVERIVSEAGGKIRVESKAGKGSTIFVTLPINKGRRY